MEMEKSDRRTRPSFFGLEPVMAMLPSVSEITTTGRISLSIVTKKTRRVQNIIAALAVLARLLDAGDLSVSVAGVLPFDRLAEAQRLVASGHVRGRIVLQL